MLEVTADMGRAGLVSAAAFTAGEPGTVKGVNKTGKQAVELNVMIAQGWLAGSAGSIHGSYSQR